MQTVGNPSDSPFRNGFVANQHHRNHNQPGHQSADQNCLQTFWWVSSPLPFRRACPNALTMATAITTNMRPIPAARKAEKRLVKLKMDIQGPSGSGKTEGAEFRQ
jgi:hypothetical protein